MSLRLDLRSSLQSRPISSEIGFVGTNVGLGLIEADGLLLLFFDIVIFSKNRINKILLFL